MTMGGCRRKRRLPKLRQRSAQGNGLDDTGVCSFLLTVASQSLELSSARGAGRCVDNSESSFALPSWADLGCGCGCACEHSTQVMGLGQLDRWLRYRPRRRRPYGVMAEFGHLTATC